MTGARDQGVTDLPANVIAMFPEVAGLVLDDWAIERGYTFAADVREATVKIFAGSMERSARRDPGALSPLAPMTREVLRRHVRAWAEPALLRTLNEAAERLALS
jgi:hypothetical protein